MHPDGRAAWKFQEQCLQFNNMWQNSAGLLISSKVIIPLHGPPHCAVCGVLEFQFRITDRYYGPTRTYIIHAQQLADKHRLRAPDSI